MAIIGEAFIAVRPLMTGFGLATKEGLSKEIAAQDLFGGVRSQSKLVEAGVADDAAKAGKKVGDAFEDASSRVSKSFTKVGESLANWGVPFSGSIGKIGSKIDDADTKGKKLGATLSTAGGLALGVGAAGFAAVAAESVHLASGLLEADGQIASHENISVKAAQNIGKAFETSAGQTIFSANEQAESFAPVSGELDQISGHALTAGQSLKFMSATGDLAEATGGQLGSTTAAVASIMQGFQIPLSGTTQLTNQLFNASRITGVGVDSLGSTIDRLKARLGVAAPSVSDLSSLLVDLNEHGVQGSRGLQVVNTAVNTLLESVPKVSLAAAQQANSLSNSIAASADTVKNAQTAVANAQTAASIKVANAQQKVADVQDEIAASNTASAPTTAQQISLQNAQTALSQAQAAATQTVTDANTKLSQAQQKAGEVTKTASLSSNQQVAVMQQLGLQVYNAAGKFVGMRSIIAQLQPKLEGMTQQQQLFTLQQIFGAGASKALLDTVLAGPSAYDKASKAVNDSSTAHKGAAVQNQNLQRQLDILKASLVDEGDKLGTFLIPKLEDLAKWTTKDIEFFEKHKKITEALAIAIGVGLSVAVGTFVYGKGKEFTQWIGKGITGLEKLSNKLLGTAFDTQTAGEKEAAAQQAAQEKIQASQQAIADSAQESAGSITASMDNLATQLQALADKIGGSTTQISESIGSIVPAADEATAQVSATNAELVADTETTTAAIVASMEERDAAYASSAGAAEAGAATTTEAGAVGAAGAGAEGAEVAGAGALGAGGAAATGLGATAGLSSILPAAIAGFVAFKATGDLLHHNILDSGTAVTKLGNFVAGLFGHSSAQDTARDQKNDAKKYLTKADLPYLGQIVSGAIKSSTISVKLAKEDIKEIGGHAAAVSSSAGGLSSQLTVLQQLQANAKTALAQHGATSKQYLSAQASLYATERKWLPSIATNESVSAVSKTLWTTTVARNAAQAHATSLIAKDGTLAAQKAQLSGLQTTLSQQKAAGASETTLKQTHQEIKAAETHLDQLKSVNSKIAKDTTAIQNAQKLKASIDAVNANMTRLRQQIATTPPPTQKMGGTPKLKVVK